MFSAALLVVLRLKFMPLLLVLLQFLAMVAVRYPKCGYSFMMEWAAISIVLVFWLTKPGDSHD